MGGGVGDGIGVNPPEYPPHAYYYLSSGKRPESVLLSLGPRSIYYWRKLTPSGDQYGAPTNEVSGPNSRDRLLYISSLGNFQQNMPIRDEESRSIEWQGQKALELEKETFTRDILQRHEVLIRMLMESHMLTAEEARIMPNPTIEVRIQDLRPNGKP